MAETLSLGAVERQKRRLVEISAARAKTTDYEKRQMLDEERDKILRDLGPTRVIKRRRSAWTR